jgi:hypothetical protein
MQPMWTRIAAAGKCLTLLITFASVFVWFSDEGCTEQPLKAAVFGLELLDTSEEGTITGERSDQTQRVVLANAELRRLLDASGQIIGVDLTPQITEIERSTPLFSCKGCEQKIARSLGADVTIIGLVQKTSNLILSFKVEVKDVRSGAVLRGGQVDIRGNTDEMWLRGVRFLVKNRLTDPPLALPAR